MERFIYQLVRYALRNYDYGYYALYNDQFLDDNEEAVNYPVIMFEPVSAPVQYEPHRVMRYEFFFNIHIYTQTYGVIRDEDETEDVALKHFDIVNDVVRLIDGVNTLTGLDEDIPEINNFDSFKCGVIDVEQKIYNLRDKSAIQSIIEFKVPLLDTSNWTEEFATEREITDVEGDVDLFEQNFNLRIK